MNSNLFAIVRLATADAVDVRGLCIAMGQYSSLCEGAAVISLGDVDFWKLMCRTENK